MTRLALTLVLLLTVGGALAEGDVLGYDLRVQIDTQGAGDALLTLTVDRSTRVALAFASPEGVTVISGPEGVTVTVEQGSATQTRLLVLLQEGTPVPATVMIRFRVPDVLPQPVSKAGERATLPAGAYLLKHTFVNTEPETIRRYAVAFGFPPSLRAHATREGRVRLLMVDGAPGAQLEALNVAQGGSVSLVVELGPRARSWGWILAGLVVGLLYLVSFRDLVSRPAA